MISYKITAMQNLVPGCSFAWKGEEWEGLEWLDSRPCPTREAWETEKARLIAYAPLQTCKDTAKTLLASSDWAELPSSIELLENASEWKAYRVELKRLLISPVEAPSFPNIPEVRWKV